MITIRLWPGRASTHCFWANAAVWFLLGGSLLLGALPARCQPTMGWQRVATLGGYNPQFTHYETPNRVFATAPGPNHTLYVAGIYAAGTVLGGPPAYFDSVAVDGDGVEDAYLACFGPDGRMQWARTVAGPGNDQASGLAVDAQGNATIYGWCSAGAIYDPLLAPTLTRGAFLATYTPTGALHRFQPLAVDWLHLVVRDIAYDGRNNLFFSGYVNQSTQLDTLPIAANPRTALTWFVAKRRPSGAWAWVSARTSGCVADEAGTVALAADSAGNAYVTASFRNRFSWDADTVRGQPIVQFGGWSQFVAALDSSGAVRWLQALEPRQQPNVLSNNVIYPYRVRLVPTERDRLLVLCPLWNEVVATASDGTQFNYATPGADGPTPFLLRLKATTGRIYAAQALLQRTTPGGRGFTNTMQYFPPNSLYLLGENWETMMLGNVQFPPFTPPVRRSYVAHLDTLGAPRWVVQVEGHPNSAPIDLGQVALGVAATPAGALVAGEFMMSPTVFPPGIQRTPIHYCSVYVGLVGQVAGLPEASAPGTRAQPLRAFPNPVAAGADLHLALPPSLAPAGGQVRWLNATGQVVRAGVLPPDRRLSTVGLVPGLYLVQVSGAGPTCTLRVSVGD